MAKKIVMRAEVVAESYLAGDDLTPEGLEEAKESMLVAFFGDEGVFAGEPGEWLSEPEFTIVDA